MKTSETSRHSLTFKPPRAPPPDDNAKTQKGQPRNDQKQKPHKDQTIKQLLAPLLARRASFPAHVYKRAKIMIRTLKVAGLYEPNGKGMPRGPSTKKEGPGNQKDPEKMKELRRRQVRALRRAQISWKRMQVKRKACEKLKDDAKAKAPIIIKEGEEEENQCGESYIGGNHAGKGQGGESQDRRRISGATTELTKVNKDTEGSAINYAGGIGDLALLQPTDAHFGNTTTPMNMTTATNLHTFPQHINYPITGFSCQGSMAGGWQIIPGPYTGTTSTRQNFESGDPILSDISIEANFDGTGYSKQLLLNSPHSHCLINGSQNQNLAREGLINPGAFPGTASTNSIPTQLHQNSVQGLSFRSGFHDGSPVSNGMRYSQELLLNSSPGFNFAGSVADESLSPTTW